MCKHHETGIRAIRAYTGASAEEVLAAVADGHLSTTGTCVKMKAKHTALDAWLVRRVLVRRAKVRNEGVQFVADGDQPAQRGAVA